MLDVEVLKTMLSYNPDNGLFTWKVKKGSMLPGYQAGGESGNGYVYLHVDDLRIGAHRLAFLFMGSDIPREVDHINDIRNDNRWCNLAPATPSSNRRNTKLRTDNYSGIVGVFYDFERGKWRAGIGKIGLGRFDTLLDAVAARKSAELKLNFHENHGRK